MANVNASGSHSNGSRIGLGSLIHWAKEDGWSPPWERSTNGSRAHSRRREHEIDKNDLGNARTLVEMFGRDFRYCFQWKKFLFWDERRWKLDDIGQVERWAKEVVDSYKRRNMLKDAKRAGMKTRLDAMVSLAKSEPGIHVLPDRLDAAPWLFDVANGTLNLRNGALQPHNRDDMLTQLCRVNFRANASCECFEAFLRAILVEDDIIRFVQRFFGYCLTGETTEQLMLILWGCGANGKTTLLKTIMHVLGSDFAMKAGRELIAEQKHQSHSTERMDLFGKRLVVCSETERDEKLAMSFVKDLTGSEKIRGRRMREDSWEYDPTHKLVLMTNHRPKIDATDEASWRRIALLPFTVRFWNPDKGETGPLELRQDKGLFDSLLSEAEGILAWLVDGCLAYVKHGLQIPERINLATDEYRRENDSTFRFLQECTVPGGSCRLSDLSQRYTRWTSANGGDYLSDRELSRYLVNRGYEKFTNNGTCFRGLSLIAEEEE